MTDDRIPQDLVPLPTAPYSERPASMPLEVEECRTAIWRCRGNVSSAAEMLKVSSQRLRKFVSNSRYLQSEVNEARERLADIAEDVVYEALTQAEDAGRRDSMARFVLGSLGKSRGFASGGGTTAVHIKGGSGPIQITWGDGTGFSPEPSSNRTIEGEVVSD